MTDREIDLIVMCLSAIGIAIILIYLYLRKMDGKEIYTVNSVEVVRANHIIRFKHLYTKIQIQKAQQFLDNVKLS